MICGFRLEFGTVCFGPPRLGSWEVKEGLQLETTADSFPLWKSPQVPIIPGKIQFKRLGETMAGGGGPLGQRGPLVMPLHRSSGSSSFQKMAMRAGKAPRTRTCAAAAIFERKHRQRNMNCGQITNDGGFVAASFVCFLQP